MKNDLIKRSSTICLEKMVFFCFNGKKKLGISAPVITGEIEFSKNFLLSTLIERWK